MGDAGVPDQKTARHVRLLPSKILTFISLPSPAWATMVGRDEPGGQEGERGPQNAGLRTLTAKLSLLP